VFSPDQEDKPIEVFLFRWGSKSNQNPKGHTGNPIVDLFNGREINPTHFGLDFKLQTFRSVKQIWIGLFLLLLTFYDSSFLHALVAPTVLYILMVMTYDNNFMDANLLVIVSK
jgi:hypothetical protein